MAIYNRTVEYFTCQFKCGKLATILSTMEKHEKICFCNPETKSCRICTHYIVDSESVGCEIYKFEMGNADKNNVYNGNGITVWDGKNEKILMENDIFYVPKERPFPKSNCMQFELGKKAY